MKSFIAGAITLLALLSPGRAALTWEKTVVETIAPVEQEKLEASFAFKNSGTQPVTILSVNTSCGCTTASLAKKTYEPGESGEVTTVFAFEGRTGKQEKTIQVITSDGSDPVTLVLHVTLLDTFTLKPRILLWKKGGTDSATKTALLTASRNVPLSPTDVRCDSPLFEVSLVPLEAGQRYELRVTPKSVATAGKATVRIETEPAPGRRATTVVYAVIQ